MKQLPTICALTLAMSLASFTIYAQSFLWAKRGGSTNTLQRSQDNNNVIDMVTDAADNVYLLCRVGASSLQVDGHPLQAYSAVGIGDSRDILLTSFSKNGQYRWSKVIGRGANDYDSDLKVHNGDVYLSGNTRPTGDSAFFDTDTVYHQVYNGYQAKNAFLIKYDTSGVFQWLQMPGAEDTIPIGGVSEYGYWFDIAPNGDIYWLCDLMSGCLPNTTQPIMQRGAYVLRYNQNGQLLGQTRLDVNYDNQFKFNGNYNEGNFIRDHQTGNFYLGGTYDSNVPLVIGNDTITDRMYVAAFDNTGQVLWKKVGVGINSNDNINDIKMDGQGNLYLTGQTSNGAAFNGYTFTSPQIYSTPFIMKMDGQGNLVWGKTATALAGTPATAITLNGAEVAITGFSFGLYWQGPNDLDTLKAVPNQGYDAFIARFDTQSGDLLGMESAQTPFGGASYGYSITADSEGSYYLGGNFDQQLFMGPDTLYKIGSQRSFFVAKYACGVPEAAFTVNQDSIQYIYNYTGTPADSVLWDFGDGSAPYKGDSVTHVYSAMGQYVVCATAYDASCGDTTFCKTVDVTTVSLYEQAFAEVAVYPNPVRDVLYINGAPKFTTYQLLSLSGKVLKEGEVRNTGVYLNDLNKGVYLLQLNSKTGSRINYRILKE